MNDISVQRFMAAVIAVMVKVCHVVAATAVSCTNGHFRARVKCGKMVIIRSSCPRRSEYLSSCGSRDALEIRRGDT